MKTREPSARIIHRQVNSGYGNSLCGSAPPSVDSGSRKNDDNISVTSNSAHASPRLPELPAAPTLLSGDLPEELDRLQRVVAEQSLKLMVMEAGKGGGSGAAEVENMKNNVEANRAALEEIHQLLVSEAPSLSALSGNQNTVDSVSPRKGRQHLLPSGKPDPQSASQFSIPQMLKNLREAALQQKSVVASLQRKNDAHARLIRAMEKELGQYRAQKNASSVGITGTGTGGFLQPNGIKTAVTASSSSGLPSDEKPTAVLPFFMPNAEELQKLSAKVEEFRLLQMEAEDKIRALQIDLEKRKSENLLLKEELKREHEMASTLKALQEKETNDALAAAMDGGGTTPLQHRSPAAHHRSPGGKKEKGSLSASNTSPQRLADGKDGATTVTTHHVRLFTGRDYVNVFQINPEALQVAIVDDLCVAFPILRDSVRQLDIRAGPRSLTVELELRHPANLSGEDVEIRLWNYDFPQVETLADTMSASRQTTLPPPEDSNDAVSAATPSRRPTATGSLTPTRPRTKSSLLGTSPSSLGTSGGGSTPAVVQALTQQLQQTRDLLGEKEAELQRWQERHAKLRDTQVQESAAVDEDVNAVLSETATTIALLHEQLQRRDEDLEELVQECEALDAEVVRCHELLQSQEHVLEAQENESHAEHLKALEQLRQQVEQLEEEVSQKATKNAELEDAVAKAAVISTSEVFECVVPLSSMELADFMASLLTDNNAPSPCSSSSMSHEPHSGNGTRSGSGSGKLGSHWASSHIPTIHAILLQSAATASGAIPIRVRRVTMEAGRVAVKVRVELGFSASASERESQASRIRRQLEQNSSKLVPTLEDFLRFVASVPTQKTSAELSSNRPSHRLSISENTEFACLLDAMLSAKERLNATSTSEQLALVAQKYGEMEASVQKLRIEAVQMNTRIRVKESENERLKKEVKDQKLMLATATSPEDELNRVNPTAAEQEQQWTEKEQRYEEVVAKLEREVRHLKRDLEEAKRKEKKQDALLADQNQLVESLHQQVQEFSEVVAAQGSSAIATPSRPTNNGAALGGASPATEVRLLKSLVENGAQERERLMKQVKDLETDMADLAGIQHSLQSSLEQHQRKLRVAQGEKEELKKRIAQLSEEKRAWMLNHSSSGKNKELNTLLEESITLLRQNIEKASHVTGLDVLAPTSRVMAALENSVRSHRDADHNVDDSNDDDQEDAVVRATTQLHALARQLGSVMDPLVDGSAAGGSAVLSRSGHSSTVLSASPSSSGLTQRPASSSAALSASRTALSATTSSSASSLLSNRSVAVKQPGVTSTSSSTSDVSSRLAAAVPGSRYAAWAASRKAAVAAAVAGNTTKPEGTSSSIGSKLAGGATPTTNTTTSSRQAALEPGPASSSYVRSSSRHSATSSSSVRDSTRSVRSSAIGGAATAAATAVGGGDGSTRLSTYSCDARSTLGSRRSSFGAAEDQGSGRTGYLPRSREDVIGRSSSSSGTLRRTPSTAASKLAAPAISEALSTRRPK